MQSSMFNLRVPLTARDEVFLMNTLTDAQLVVSSDVAALLDRTPDWRALEGAVRAVRSAPEGTRNVTLNAEAFGIGQLVALGALHEGEAEDELVSAAVSAGLFETEARRTVRSAFRGGATKPRDVGSAS